MQRPKTSSATLNLNLLINFYVSFFQHFNSKWRNWLFILYKIDMFPYISELIENFIYWFSNHGCRCNDHFQHNLMPTKCTVNLISKETVHQKLRWRITSCLSNVISQFVVSSYEHTFLFDLKCLVWNWRKKWRKKNARRSALQLSCQKP